MEMMRNRYLKIDKPIEEIAVMEIKFYRSYNDREGIEELGIEEEVNVLIYKNHRGYGEEFVNIYRTVEIMITTEETIYNDKYKKLPDNIEYVIVENKIYRVKDEFNMIMFMSWRKKEEYIRRMIEEGRVNENNDKGETALYLACEDGMGIAMELIPRMSDTAIDKCTKAGRTALYSACFMGTETVALELVSRMSEGAINKWLINGRTALMTACETNKEKVALELIRRMNREAISKWTEDGETALYWACEKKMERVALELIPRMSEEAINKIKLRMNTALMSACANKMERVAIELIRRMRKEIIEIEGTSIIGGIVYSAKIYALRNGMMRVVEMIE